jgi:hypothetical protein
MNPKTYNQWLKLGRPVRKGERHTGRNSKGECTFTENQVMDEYELDEMLSELDGCRYDIY